MMPLLLSRLFFLLSRLFFLNDAIALKDQPTIFSIFSMMPLLLSRLFFLNDAIAPQPTIFYQ